MTGSDHTGEVEAMASLSLVGTRCVLLSASLDHGSPVVRLTPHPAKAMSLDRIRGRQDFLASAENYLSKLPHKSFPFLTIPSHSSASSYDPMQQSRAVRTILMPCPKSEYTTSTSLNTTHSRHDDIQIKVFFSQQNRP